MVILIEVDAIARQGFTAKAASTILIAVAFAVAFAFAVLFIGLGIYVSRRAMKGDPKFALVRSFALAFGAWGGTNFAWADLTDTDFTRAHLKSTNFYQAILTRTCWHDAKKLDRARPGESILADLKVLNLLVTGEGRQQSFVSASLRGANLKGAILTGANLKWAELSEATLEKASLRNANLIETMAIGTDFTEAMLTGACIEGWNIDHTTKLTQIRCQYIYLLRNQRERRPSSGTFEPGEFTQLFQQVIDTIDFIFRNGVDWKAVIEAFREVQAKNKGIKLSIRSIENKGDGMIVMRVNAPPQADKPKIHQEFIAKYEVLAAKLEEKSRQVAFLEGVVRQMASRTIEVKVNATAASKAMNESTDQSQQINVGKDFNITATNAVVNLRDISGTVTNTIGQLQTSKEPDAPQLADLLTQLQTQIETNPDLDDNAKARALKLLNALAQAGQNRSNPTLREQAETALDALTTILGKAASLVTVALPLLDKVKGVLGFLV